MGPAAESNPNSPSPKSTNPNSLVYNVSNFFWNYRMWCWDFETSKQTRSKKTEGARKTIKMFCDTRHWEQQWGSRSQERSRPKKNARTEEKPGTQKEGRRIS